MSKPPAAKPKASEPVRLPNNPPPNTRKASGPVAKGTRSPSKFYDGPTVPKNAVEAKQQAKVAADKAVSVAKSSSKKVARVAKRHPWSIISLLTTIPFLITVSLFSTILCPSPDQLPSGVSKFVQSRLGIYDGPSELRQTLCYPANRYQKEFLGPYVYTAIENTRNTFEGTHTYKSVVYPKYTLARDTGNKYWKSVLQPILNRIYNGARRVYLTTIEPHVPYLRTKWYTLTAPISDRISATHRQYLSPHISTGQKYAKLASNHAAYGYRYASSHPFSKTAGKYAQTGYKKGGEAYIWSRPHAHRIFKRAEKITREQVVPRLTVALKWVVDHLEEGFYLTKSQVSKQYITHLDPHLHPYTSKASAALSPYTSAFTQKVYNPYLRAYVHYLVPATLLAPEPPKSFWTMISDFLPSPGSHAAERKGSMSEKARKEVTSVKAKATQATAVAKEQASKASSIARASASSASSVAKASASSVSSVAAKSASSAASVASRSASSISSAAKGQASTASASGQSVVNQVTSAGQSASASGSSKSASASGEKGKMTKADFESARDVIASKLDAQGKASISKLREELIGVQTKFFEDTYPKMADTNKKELTKDIDYILSGMDKLYSESDVLTREQVKQSGVMAEQRLMTKLATVKGRGGEVARVTKDQGKPALMREMDAVDAVLGKDWTDLAMKIAWIDGMTAKDRQKFNALRKSADDFKSRLAAMHESASNDKSVQAAESKLSGAIKELSTELDDLFAGYRERVKTLQKSANDKIEARDMMKASRVAASAAKSSAHTAKGDRATILPIIPGAAAARVDAPVDGIIGKGKEQIMQALSQASAAVAASETSEGVAASASSVYSAAASVVHDATRSASRALGATPVPENIGEHVESVVGQASKAASSAYDAAASVIHDATRSASRAVGVTPSPESPVEYVQSIRDAAGKSAESVASAASSVVDQATRSIKSAVGANEPTGTYQVSIESLAPVGSSSGCSTVSIGKDNIHQVKEAVRSAMSSLHVATESIITHPAVPTVNAYLASMAKDMAAGAASVYGVVEENVQQATKSVKSAAGSTPTPESPVDHVQSYAAEVSKSAESVVSVASASVSSAASAVSASAVSVGSNAGASIESVRSVVQSAVHDGTRSIIKAAGATPSPEGAQEHFEAYTAAAAEKLGKLMNEVQGSASSIADVASSAVHSGTRSIIKAAGGTPTAESPRETIESVVSVASASAQSVYTAVSSVGDDALSQALVLSASIRSVLGLQPTPLPTPMASSASAYLASLTSAGVSAGNEALSTGSSILAALQSQLADTQGEAGKRVKEVVEQVRGAVAGKDEL